MTNFREFAVVVEVVPAILLFAIDGIAAQPHGAHSEDYEIQDANNNQAVPQPTTCSRSHWTAEL
jgi:hypothetical protein